MSQRSEYYEGLARGLDMSCHDFFGGRQRSDEPEPVPLPPPNFQEIADALKALPMHCAESGPCHVCDSRQLTIKLMERAAGFESALTEIANSQIPFFPMAQGDMVPRANADAMRAVARNALV